MPESKKKKEDDKKKKAKEVFDQYLDWNFKDVSTSSYAFNINVMLCFTSPDDKQV